MFAVPLQVIDNFLLQFNAGQVIFALFIVSVLGVLPLKSMKVMGLNLVAFGLLFLMTPSQVQPIHFKFLGLALLFVGPLLVVSSRR
ncbi:hypothetical protein [Halorarius halobius]|uniref:hypothetical protein n=1 Tax=Halorarius halobius TaxID=2962671 RepID=UPI0020CDD8F9|nr:hypothetical protein [Halorarius halobius]